MNRFVVGLSALPHLPQDLQPALAQTAQRTGVAFAFGSLGLVIRLGPGAELSTAVAPQVNGMAQVPVAVPPDFGPPDLPADKTHRRRPGHALQALGLRILPS